MDKLNEFDSVTILKYAINGKFKYHVMDKFDERSEPKRLDKMMAFSDDLAFEHGDNYEQLWIKTCPIFPTK